MTTQAKHVAGKPDTFKLEASATPRPLYMIARDILQTWAKPNYAAMPYLDAMRNLDKISDHFGYDDARSIVRYFLSNATTWRGDDARRIKAELRAML